jgi:cobalt-zinc-cadmium efflux system protein
MHNHSHHHPHPEAGQAREHVCGEGMPAHDGATVRKTDRNRLLLTLIITTVVMVTELVGGLWSRSLALQSDAVHLLTDVAALLLSWLAILLATRPADDRRTYGYYRLEILAALINGVVLIGLSGYVLISAYQRFRTPVPVRADLVMIFALIGLVAMSVSMLLLRSSRSLNVRGAFLHVAGDALTSVAVLGGGAVMHFWPRVSFIDPLLSSLIGLAVVWNAVTLIKEAVDVLLEAAPREIDLAGVVHALESIGGVCRVHDLHVWTITSGMHALSAHVVVAADLSAGSHDALLTRMKEMLLSDYRIAHSTLQIESEHYEHIGH